MMEKNPERFAEAKQVNRVSIMLGSVGGTADSSVLAVKPKDAINNNNIIIISKPNEVTVAPKLSMHQMSNIAQLAASQRASLKKSALTREQLKELKEGPMPEGNKNSIDDELAQKLANQQSRLLGPNLTNGNILVKMNDTVSNGTNMSRLNPRPLAVRPTTNTPKKTFAFSTKPSYNNDIGG